MGWIFGQWTALRVCNQLLLLLITDKSLCWSSWRSCWSCQSKHGSVLYVTNQTCVMWLHTCSLQIVSELHDVYSSSGGYAAVRWFWSAAWGHLKSPSEAAGGQKRHGLASTTCHGGPWRSVCDGSARLSGRRVTWLVWAHASCLSACGCLSFCLTSRCNTSPPALTDKATEQAFPRQRRVAVSGDEGLKQTTRSRRSACILYPRKQVTVSVSMRRVLTDVHHCNW